MNTYYLRVEAVNLKNFVDDTQDLNTIRGGNLLLLNAVHEIPNYFQYLKNLTVGASAGLYSIEVEDEISAEKIRFDIEKWLKEDVKLQHATFVVDIQLMHGDDKFAEDIEMILSRNHWRQMQLPTVVLNDETSSTICEIDLVRPATQRLPGPDGEPISVSESVAVRRKDGQKLKQQFYANHIEEHIEARFVHELGELTIDDSKGNLSGKMAVIYLDGNRFGEIKKSLIHNPEQWLEFDRKLNKYRRDILKSLLRLVKDDTDWQTQEGHYRIETLMWGGDEILWVVPAWKGWETLAYFYTISATWNYHSEPLSHSAGLVFCNHKAPIHGIIQLAKDLAEFCKINRTQNLFAYEILESFDHIGNNLHKYRKTNSPQPIDPTIEIDPTSLILAGQDMLTISAFVNSIREQMPRKQLHDVAKDVLSPTRLGIEHSVNQELYIQRTINRRELITKLKTKLNEGGMLPETLDHIKTKMGGEDALWLHLNALWDYLVFGKEIPHA